MTSASRFTRSPGCRKPRVVRAEGLGNQGDGETVASDVDHGQEIPSTVIEPFGTR
jgi:hypothetical protein